MSLKNEPAVRYAIWTAYNRRCQITKNLIENITDMEVDHIISVDTFKNKEKIKIYDLPEDFDVNGLENLRPVLRVWNREKSNQELPSEQVILNLMKARKIKKLVKREIAKFHEEKKYALSIEAIREAIQNKETSLEEYMDQIKGYQVDFGDKVIKFESEFTKSVEVNSHSVRISGHLPRLEEREGSCLFTFNSFYLRQVNISLSHQEILKTLYGGYKTPLILSMRPYIMENTSNQELKTYSIIIGGCVFNLELEEVKHLIRAIDIFMENYIEAIKEIENKLESNNFYPMVHDLNNYKLICIPVKLFEKIMLFIQKHDYAEGDSKWHIFDSHGRMIKIYDKNAREYRCFIYPIADNNDGYSWYNSNDRVWLVWDYMSISGKELWSVQKTYRWLVEDLIPTVETFFTPSRGSIFKKRKNSITVSQLIYTSNDKYYDINKKVSASQLLNIVESLQVMYSLGSKIYMNWSDYLNVYDAILYLMKICPKLDYYYICSKLSLGQIENKEELWKAIEQLKQNEVEGIINSGKLDMLFRAFFALVKDTLHVITEEDIAKVISLVKEHVNIYNDMKLVESQWR
ncbi:hypothetical protein ACQGSH_14820 [Bacillus wiedmannii]|uniref:hypothetical protein n=1 Tax=Bacillus wiedmannii TaxID=1890302 RepID=UPI001F08A0E6|nr:hypothetical protein [Bacillus wiedmannii]MCX3313328.1 hypothetical protein [Bacillus wiedmannii]